MAQQTSDRGWGVFTAEPIAAGDLVVVYGGRVVTTDQVRVEDLQDWVIQIEEDLFLAPWRLPEEDDPGAIAERINHCCRPNLGFAGQVSAVALCEIPVGIELTLDYGTCDARVDYQFECRCGVEGCRRTVSGEDWRDPGLQARLMDYFQPFLQRRVWQAGGVHGSIF